MPTKNGTSVFPSDLGQILYTFIEQLKRHVSVRYILLYTVTRGRSEDWLSPSFINRLDPEYGPSFLKKSTCVGEGWGWVRKRLSLTQTLIVLWLRTGRRPPRAGFRGEAG